MGEEVDLQVRVVVPHTVQRPQECLLPAQHQALTVRHLPVGDVFRAHHSDGHLHTNIGRCYRDRHHHAGTDMLYLLG